MKEPCSNCPFRSDRRFKGLHPEKAMEIAQALHRDSSFHCHKTLDYSEGDGGKTTPKSKLCTGAAMFLENTRRGGMIANLAFRFGYIRGEIKPEHLSNKIPVYTSIEEFIDSASS